MATTQAINTDVLSVSIKRGDEVQGVLHAMELAAELLGRSEKINVQGRLGEKTFNKEMGGGDEDEDFENILAESRSLMRTIEGWLKMRVCGEELLLKIYAV